jgi:hypothetical protein
MLKTVTAVVAVFVLMVASPARAELTPQEKASVAHLQNVTNTVATALSTYIAYTLNAYMNGDAGGRAALADGALATLQVLAIAQDAFSALAGDVATEQEGTQVWADLKAAGRAGRVAGAVTRIQGLKWLLPWARSYFEAAKAYNADPTYRDYLQRAQDILSRADGELAQVDTSLPFGDPKPVNDPRFRPEAVVGPHGNFEMTHWHRWRGRLYTISTMTSLMEALKAGSSDMRYANAGRVLMGLANVVSLTINETAATSGLAANGDPFGRTLETLRVLQSKRSGVPGALHFFHFDLKDMFLTQMGKSATFDWWVMHATVTIADAWANLDESAWQLNIFPGCPPVCLGGR